MIIQNNAFNLNKAMSELQGLGICLKIAVNKLPNSTVKQYLLYKIINPIEINSLADFQKLQDMTLGMLSVVTQELNDEEIPELLKAMDRDIVKIIQHIEADGKV